MAFWIGWQAVVAPMLGAEPARERTLLWPTLVAVDHVLYGLVVSGRLTR